MKGQATPHSIFRHSAGHWEQIASDRNDPGGPVACILVEVTFNDLWLSIKDISTLAKFAKKQNQIK